ncbi:MAG TPA: 50S ribosomal protein L2 [Acidobacteriota bacterium]|nr:50S ribosomal protein L2 [Acidobacteriota bacterium]
MGKLIIAQRRGKGSSRYRAHSFNFAGKATHPVLTQNNKTEVFTGTIVDFIKCAAHTAPLAQVEYSNGDACLMLACEGLKVGDTVTVGAAAEAVPGNIMPLSVVPEGTLVFNIESMPGDGGKFVRASGVFARVVAKTANGILVRLPSKKQRFFNENCRASIGVLAGGGRIDKPLLKAGNKFFKFKARNHLYPKTSASKMNAVDHPYGNKRSSRKSKAMPVARNAPPGRKVGMIAARRTGRKKK